MSEIVFIAGSMQIKNLDPLVKARIDKIVDANLRVVVGDADGADSSVQNYLIERKFENATIYCSGDSPRNNLGHWPVKAVEAKHAPGTRAFFTIKDVAMAMVADYGLMIWDTKSTGTLSNILELLKRKKKTVVFVNKDKAFHTISGISQLEALIGRMSDTAKKKADDKIRLSQQINQLRNEQLGMF